jgi:hypothetical protein
MGWSSHVTVDSRRLMQGKRRNVMQEQMPEIENLEPQRTDAWVGDRLAEFPFQSPSLASPFRVFLVSALCGSLHVTNDKQRFQPPVRSHRHPNTRATASRMTPG